LCFLYFQEKERQHWRRILLLIVAITVHNIPEGIVHYRKKSNVPELLFYGSGFMMTTVYYSIPVYRLLLKKNRNCRQKLTKKNYNLGGDLFLRL
jgi:hypothetical protein